MANRTPLAIAIVIAAVVLTLFLITPIGVLVGGLFIGSEENIDFIAGNNMGITAVADPTSDVVRVTFTSTATGTATSTGDITDVGPGCSTGPCLTDSVTTTGGTILVWEGTTDDGFEITFTATADPATSSVYHFEAVADHEWSPITGDFSIGDGDEGQIQLGSLTIGKANDTISTTVTDGIAFFYNDAAALVEDISFIFLGPAGIPRFVLSVEGPDLATYNPRSMLIGPAANFANVDENVLCSTNFNDIDCDTGATGADLGIEDDIEIGGSVFLSFDCIGNTNGGALTIATTSGLVSCSDDDASAGGGTISTTTIQELDVTIFATSSPTLDFGLGFDVVEGPSGEANIDHNTNEFGNLTWGDGSLATTTWTFNVTGITSTNPSLVMTPNFINASTSIYIGKESLNPFQSIGLTISNGGISEAITLQDNEGGVSHTLTITESNTYGIMREQQPGEGGLLIRGFNDTNRGIELSGTAADGIVAKVDTSEGFINLSAFQHSGGALVAPLTANDNIVSIQSGPNSIWIVDREGTTHVIVPGADVSVDLITVQVTGTPTFGWDEGGDQFTFDNDIDVTGTITETGLNATGVQDFGGATSLELPTCASTPNVDGEICTRTATSTAELIWFQDELHILSGTTTKGLFLFSPDSSVHDRVPAIAVISPDINAAGLSPFVSYC